MFTSSDSGLPKNIVVTDNGAIRYYWRRGFQAFFMTLFGVMLLWAAYYFWSPDFVPEFLICSLPLFWIPGVVLAYFGVRQAVNYTELRVDGGELLIQHKPIPWRGNKSIAMTDFEKFFVGVRRNDQTLTCDILAITKKGDRIMILSNVGPEIAEAFVREGERLMGRPISFNAENLRSVFKQEKLQVNAKASKSILLLFPMFFLTGAFLLYFGLSQQAEWRASQAWPSVSGTVLRVEIVSALDENGDRYYTPIVTYQYEVNDRSYTSQRVRISGNYHSSNKRSASKEAEQYVPNSQVTVYYDPNHPQSALLERKPLRGDKIVVGFVLMGLGVAWIPVFVLLRKRFTKEAGEQAA